MKYYIYLKIVCFINRICVRVQKSNVMDTHTTQYHGSKTVFLKMECTYTGICKARYVSGQYLDGISMPVFIYNNIHKRNSIFFI